MDSSFWKAGVVKENRKKRTSNKSLFVVAQKMKAAATLQKKTPWRVPVAPLVLMKPAIFAALLL